MTSMMGIPGASAAPTTTSRGLLGMGDADPGLTTGQKVGLGIMAVLVVIGVVKGVAS